MADDPTCIAEIFVVKYGSLPGHSYDIDGPFIDHKNVDLSIKNCNNHIYICVYIYTYIYIHISG